MYICIHNHVCYVRSACIHIYITKWGPGSEYQNWSTSLWHFTKQAEYPAGSKEMQRKWNGVGSHQNTDIFHDTFFNKSNFWGHGGIHHKSGQNLSKFYETALNIRQDRRRRNENETAGVPMERRRFFVKQPLTNPFKILQFPLYFCDFSLSLSLSLSLPPSLPPSIYLSIYLSNVRWSP